MKKITVLFLLIFLVAETQAQNYQITFAGTGASATVDSVKVENLTQCTKLNLSGSDILHLASNAGINELTDADNNVNIFPNPMAGTCSIDFEAIAQGKTTIVLYDITGKRILQVQESVSKGHHTYSLSGISSGIYTLKIESDNYSYTAKIVSSNDQSGIAEIKHIETTPDIDKQNTVSNSGKIENLKGGKSLIDMQYTTGDILKLTGKSGVFRTIYMLVPTQTQTVTFNFVACTDADNNNYSVVQIGTQTWMAENLKTTKYSNGNPISNITDNTQWTNLTTGAYCNYNNDANNSTTFGRLYNWYAVNTGNLCPTGWHVPTDAEWTTMTACLGGESVAGGKLKEACSTHWDSPNTGATNETGFTALPGGYRAYDGPFCDFMRPGDWWSSTEADTSAAWERIMLYLYSPVIKNNSSKTFGLSIRCVRD